MHCFCFHILYFTSRMNVFCFFKPKCCFKFYALNLISSDLTTKDADSAQLVTYADPGDRQIKQFSEFNTDLITYTCTVEQRAQTRTVPRGALNPSLDTGHSLDLFTAERTQILTTQIHSHHRGLSLIVPQWSIL